MLETSGKWAFAFNLSPPLCHFRLNRPGHLEELRGWKTSREHGLTVLVLSTVGSWLWSLPWIDCPACEETTPCYLNNAFFSSDLIEIGPGTNIPISIHPLIKHTPAFCDFCLGGAGWRVTSLLRSQPRFTDCGLKMCPKLAQKVVIYFYWSILFWRFFDWNLVALALVLPPLTLNHTRL